MEDDSKPTLEDTQIARDGNEERHNRFRHSTQLSSVAGQELFVAFFTCECCVFCLFQFFEYILPRAMDGIERKFAAFESPVFLKSVHEFSMVCELQSLSLLFSEIGRLNVLVLFFCLIF